MPITNIPFQPVSFVGSETDGQCGCGDATYCAKFNHGDTLKTQWTVDSCGENILCPFYIPNYLEISYPHPPDEDALFVNLDVEVGDELMLVEDPTTDLLSCTITQIIGNTVICEEPPLFVFFDATSISDGTSRCTTIKNVTKTLSMHPESPFEFLSASNCWEADNGNYESTSEGVCHEGAVTTFTEAAVLEPGRFYQVYLNVTDMQPGSSIKVILGTVESYTIYDAGEYNLYLEADGTDIKIVMDGDCCIGTVAAYVFPNIADWTIELRDKDDNFVQYITGITYHNNTATLTWTIPDDLDGCYTICVKEPCQYDAMDGSWDFGDEDPLFLSKTGTLITFRTSGYLFQTNIDSSIPVGEADTTGKNIVIAQSFTGMKYIDKVRLWKDADSGTYPGNVQVRISEDSLITPGQPGTPIHTTTISNSEWLALSVGEFLAIPDTLTINPADTYWIVVTTNSNDNANHPNLGIISTPDYGVMKRFNTADGWSAGLNTSLYLKIGTSDFKRASYLDFNCNQGCLYNVEIISDSIDEDFLGKTIGLIVDEEPLFITITQGMIDNNSIVFENVIVGECGGEFTLLFDNSSEEYDRLLVITDILITNSCCDYTSNCINIKAEHTCTVIMEATCNEPANGFDFTNFSLTQRLEVKFMNPIGQGKNENYKLSNGTYYKSFAERDKIFDLAFLPVDELTHDAIDTSLRCDNLIINGINYVWVEDSYKPEWDKRGALKIVGSLIQIRRKGGHLTNSNCS